MQQDLQISRSITQASFVIKAKSIMVFQTNFFPANEHQWKPPSQLRQSGFRQSFVSRCTSFMAWQVNTTNWYCTFTFLGTFFQLLHCSHSDKTCDKVIKFSFSLITFEYFPQDCIRFHLASANDARIITRRAGYSWAFAGFCFFWPCIFCGVFQIFFCTR